MPVRLALELPEALGEEAPSRIDAGEAAEPALGFGAELGDPRLEPVPW